MFLKDYFPNIDKKFEKIFFSGISFHSSKVKKDNIFFAIKGNHNDGNNFISIAIQKGCKVIVSEKYHKEFENRVLFIQTKNVRKLLAQISFKIYNKVPKNIIAVTGTNGKSSIADFYHQILKLCNKRSASIGTLGVKSKNINLNLLNTTVDPIKLGQILEKIKKHKIDNVIMEASSHGLKQNRLDGLKFSLGIFTNLSQDHLDYHKNLKEYLNSKLYLFKHLIKKDGIIVTDHTIPEYNRIIKIAKSKSLKLLTLNNKKNSFKILSHVFKGENQIIKLKYGNTTKVINLNLIGKIQLKNIFMSIIAAEKSNIKLEKILSVIKNLKPVEGRFENIGKIKNQSKVILDYAHTPEALKICLLNLKEQFPNNKITLLFGCGGDRDRNKRSKMGKIAKKYADVVYLTNDNPRFENPSQIRADIKRGLVKKKIIEISDRSEAILTAIKNLNTGEILLVAGKGHEQTQDIGKKKVFFSDKKIILNAIKAKNLILSNNLKLNIIKEKSGSKKISSSLLFNQARINSREVKKNDIFIAIKGKNNDGNKFVGQSLKKKASLAIVNKIQKNLNNNQQIKVKKPIEFLTDIAKAFRQNIETKIIAITGSCGKTTLKEMLGYALKKISKVGISPKSYNNKYGVPLSLFNLNKNNKFGVIELGMDKRGEIDYLSKIVLPDISVITNINYAHIKNFKNLKQIALAKAEIIYNTNSKGYLVLNADDKFFKFHKKLAEKKNLNIISFGIRNPRSNLKFLSIHKKGNKFKLFLKINKKKIFFYISNDFQNNIYNVLASLAVISIYINISQLNKDIFMNFEVPSGRGSFSAIKINGKNLKLIDESYNSNPLSLKSAILNFDKIVTKKSKKYLLLGDMLELGNHSKNLHKSIVPVINNTKIDKVFVKGKDVKYIFQGLSKFKQGKILYNKFDINEFLENDLNDNDYLMIKASNATGLNKIVNNLKGVK